MEVVKVYWWQHDCKDGRFSSAKIHRAVKVSLKDSSKLPSCVDDYDITLDLSEIEGFAPEEIEGV